MFSAKLHNTVFSSFRDICRKPFHKISERTAIDVKKEEDKIWVTPWKCMLFMKTGKGEPSYKMVEDSSALIY